jgi:hypothetical protein
MVIDIEKKVLYNAIGVKKHVKFNNLLYISFTKKDIQVLELNTLKIFEVFFLF